MRALSFRQASACETAAHQTCKCRCGGKLHGAKRHDQLDARFFEGLPADDPHHMRTPEEKRIRRKLHRADRKRAEEVAMGQDRLFQEPLQG